MDVNLQHRKAFDFATSNSRLLLSVKSPRASEESIELIEHPFQNSKEICGGILTSTLKLKLPCSTVQKEDSSRLRVIKLKCFNLLAELTVLVVITLVLKTFFQLAPKSYVNVIFIMPIL